MGRAADSQGQLHRVAAVDRPRIAFTLDGQPSVALDGDTVLTAILVNARNLRRFEFGGDPRAGFCLMGACQDCWVRRADGTPLRACTAQVEAGMSIVTRGTDDA